MPIATGDLSNYLTIYKINLYKYVAISNRMNYNNNVHNVQTTNNNGKTMTTTVYKKISKMAEIINELENKIMEQEEQRAEIIKRIDKISQRGTWREQLKNIQKATRDLTDLCKKIESTNKKLDDAFKKGLEAKSKSGYRKAHSAWYKANRQVIKLSKCRLTSKEDKAQAQEKLVQALASLQEVERKASDIFIAKQAKELKSSNFFTLTPCDPELYAQELKRINSITKKKYRS
jgi:chromosome segregation ATPase